MFGNVCDNPAMVGRAFIARAEPGFTLPAFERIAPPPPPDLVAARIDGHTAPGEIVVDLHGRGGWVARSAVDRQRRAFTLEANPLTRLLAEIVLRPPDVRHLDAAFQALSASPHGETSLKLWIGDHFATHCATCGRSLVLDELAWDNGDQPRPTRRYYRCTLCRDQQGGGEVRQGPLDGEDLRRATADVGGLEIRRRLRERFPVPDDAQDLGDAVLAVHTDRQLAGLEAILERVEGDLRAAPVESALRLAFLHAVLPASRLNAGNGRVGGMRIGGGRVKSTVGETWRERNPWLAFEDGFRQVRGFVQRLEGAALGPLQARFGTDLRSLAEGAATAVARVMTPGSLATLADEARDPTREPGRPGAARPRVRLVLGQPPARFSQERLAAAYHGTAWALGREAAALLPLEALAGPSIRAPWSWQAAGLRRSLEAIAPHLAPDARVVLLLESSGPEALVAAALGGIGAGFRLLDARLGEAEDESGGVVELLPPGGVLPPGPRSRANVGLERLLGGSGDSDLVPGRGLFSAPERIDARPFSAIDAARSVTETAVEVLRARGEPARYERLLGEILVGLDRTGQLRRLVAGEVRWGDEPLGPPEDVAGGGRGDASTGAPGPSPSGGALRTASSRGPRFGAGSRSVRGMRTFAIGGFAPPAVHGPAIRHGESGSSPDPVERVLALVRDELTRSTQRRLAEIEPGRWWLADKVEQAAAAVPLADRVEWAVYGLLSTAGPLSESAFFERIASMFGGHDLPDEALVRTCLASYRSPASTPERLVTGEDVRRRTAEHSELIARIANGGHRLGMSVWIGRREQGRRLGDRLLGEFLDERERHAFLPGIARAPLEDLEAVDCIWYVRHRGAFLFEVEWTAMLGDVLLRRHARIAPDEGLIRFLVIAPERTELVRYRLAASPLLREAVDGGGWQIVKWSHLRAWLARDPLELAALEPYLGLDPLVERTAEQLGLFAGPDAVP